MKVINPPQRLDPSTIKVGAHVYLQGRDGDETGTYLRGGEGRVVAMIDDKNGVCYHIQMLTTGKMRYARRGDLRVHRDY
jgi:hypothetical protein